MQQNTLRNIKRIIFAILAVLLVAVLLLSVTTHNTVNKIRASGEYTVVENVTYTQRVDSDAPIGTVDEYQFTLDTVEHAETLAFYTTHHNVAVYLAGECVYQVMDASDVFRTVGGVWAMIPLYASDAGKEVRVELSPLYRTYQMEMPDFLLGSELAIYQKALVQALPELLLSLCAVIVGLFLFCVAIYYSAKRNAMFRFYAISLLEISAGVWRFTYGNYAYFLLGSHAVFLYTVSIVVLMLVALAMLNCVEVTEHKKVKTTLQYVSVLYCIVYALQLALQLAGILDLRQTLKITHGTLIFSAIILFASGIVAWFRQAAESVRLLERDYSWLLGVGVILDLLLYYFSAFSFGVLFTLAAILCFSMLEGIKFFISYTKQEHALQEMETQLALSRTTTMMSQIRSHFVFNILNAISGMCKYDPEKADDTIIRFARYLRSNIDIMENDRNIPFTTDLQQLEDYVLLEQVRFGDKIEFYTDIEIDQFMIPPLILQPVVENAIKHGVSKKPTSGTVILRTRDMGEHIVITIEDDGVGFDKTELEKETSVGLKNIRFRLQHLVHGTLEIESTPGKGTTVTITIPKETKLCTSFM